MVTMVTVMVMEIVAMKVGDVNGDSDNGCGDVTVMAMVMAMVMVMVMVTVMVLVMR